MARRVANAVDQGTFFVDNASNQPPPFLTKTYDMVDDSRTDDTVAWSADGRSFVVWRPAEFARDLLPQHFKHNNFSSFVRQLNTYGFRKTDPDRWEFSNEYFVRQRRDLLKGIHRRKTGGAQASSPQTDAQALVAAVTGNSAIEVGSFGGLSDEVEGLRRDKNVLMMELVRLRQQQQASEQEIGKLQQRLESTESNQRNIMAFLTKALQEPGFLQQVLGHNPGPQRLTEGEPAGRRKRRVMRRGAAMDTSSPHESDTEGRDDQALVQYQTPKSDFSPQFLELLDAERDTSPTNDAASSQDGPGKLEDVTDVNSAFDNMQLALPSGVMIKEDVHGQQLPHPSASAVPVPVPSLPRSNPPSHNPSTEDFETFTANLASMLPKAGAAKASQAKSGNSQGSGPATSQHSSAQGKQPTASQQATASTPLASPWSHPRMQATTSYPLPKSAESLPTPPDFAMSLDMLQNGGAAAGGATPGAPDANGFTGPTPSQEQFWEQWMNDAPELQGSGQDAEMFNRIPSSLAESFVPPGNTVQTPAQNGMTQQ